MERSDFRIVERLNSYNESEFIVEQKVTKKVGAFLGIFGGKLQDVWKRLELEVYVNFVNDQHKFKLLKFKHRTKEESEKLISIYIEHKSRTDFWYLGHQIKPIILSHGQTNHLCYYEPKSYYSRSRYNYGYHIYNTTDEFVKKVDNNMNNGKILKIHD